MFANKTVFKREFKKKVASLFGKTLSEASQADKYATLAAMIGDEINGRWAATNKRYLAEDKRQVFYFSLEFLVGQFLENNLKYLGVEEVCRQGLKEMGLDLGELIHIEPDAGLGNGGLGRLAACFMDSLACLSLPGHGCGIRYKYGLFTQKIVDGYQVELPDNWLREANVWEIRKPDKAALVKFHGHVQTTVDANGVLSFTHEDYLPVMAVPYDMPILSSDAKTVNTLRLWSAEAVDKHFDFASFSRGDYINAVSSRYSVEAISEVLYPDDSNYQNRVLRLKQQYFFVSAGVQSILRRYKKLNHPILELPDYICIHINDTHPALAVPELMRLLMDEEGLSWEAAWEITTRCIAYTNHTIMPEALEMWPVDTFRDLLPRIMMIVEEINRRFCAELLSIYPYDGEKVRRLAILSDGVVRMANLAVVGAFSVNGVAAVHTELLRTVVMKDFYEFFPEKFNNKTNGITHRRWLIQSNGHLADLITENIGEEWITQPLALAKFAKCANKVSVQKRMQLIKRQNKERLAAYIQSSTGIIVDPASLFDVQVKRIHAYKRQLLNALHILHLYYELLDNPSMDMVPRTFIFAGKAAPSYYYAKNIIKLINELARLVNNDPVVAGRIRVVFLENYGVALAEKIFPASEISEQISTATKEASGTGNMKFMLNGALTIGTDDGANIEIRQAVGDDNFILFGLSVDEVLAYHANGGYNSIDLCDHDPRLVRIMEGLQGHLFPHLPHDEFSGIVRSLLQYNDEFFVLRDFDSYVTAQKRVDALCHDPKKFTASSIANVAHAGVFSSDNTIAQYAREIWKL